MNLKKDVSINDLFLKFVNEFNKYDLSVRYKIIKYF